MTRHKTGFLMALCVLVVLCVLTVWAGTAWSESTQTHIGDPTQMGDPTVQTASQNLYDYVVSTIDSNEQSLSAYQGKALLIVNTASRCGFTPQYKALQALYDKYSGRGFEVLAFPANNFMNQEPGTDAEIQSFCSLKFHTTFPLFAKISVKGDDIHPLYRYLTSACGFNGDISWNFNKFLVAPDGRVVARFDSKTEPLSEKLVSQLEAVLQ